MLFLFDGYSSSSPRINGNRIHFYQKRIILKIIRQIDADPYSETVVGFVFTDVKHP
jgi:hypothetical protein